MLKNSGKYGREATISYEDGDYQILVPGDFVRCAVSGEAIPLNELCYWNPVHQEAYKTADLALQRWQEIQAAEE